MIPRRGGWRILLAALLAAGGLAAIAAPGATAAEPAVAQQEIEDEVMCPTCGTLLSLSASPQAERQRALIRRMLNEGHSKQEVKDALVEEFGPEVLAVPRTSGFDLAAWLVPGAGLLLAAAAIAVGVRRWRRATPSPAAGPDLELDPEEQRRLREDLRNYEL